MAKTDFLLIHSTAHFIRTEGLGTRFVVQMWTGMSHISFAKTHKNFFLKNPKFETRKLNDTKTKRKCKLN